MKSGLLMSLFRFFKKGNRNERFRFLERLGELSGRVIDNANFFQVNSIPAISDKELYDLLLQEYPKWENK